MATCPLKCGMFYIDDINITSFIMGTDPVCFHVEGGNSNTNLSGTIIIATRFSLSIVNIKLQICGSLTQPRAFI